MRNIPRARKKELPDMRLTSYGDLLDADLDDGPELVQGLIPAVSCGFFAGVPKCGKTWAVLDMAIAIATGQTFLGRSTLQCERPILYIAGEGGASKLRTRLQWLSNGRRIPHDYLRDRIHLSIAPRIQIDRGDGFEALEQTVQRLKPSLVILDPLTRFHTANENSTSEVEGPILTPLRHLSEEYQLSLMLVHHSAKWKKGRFDPLRGTSSFQGWYDYLLYYEPSVAKTDTGDDDENGEIDGFKFCAQLRDNEEPPKRDLILTIDQNAEKASVKVAHSGTTCATLPRSQIRNQILTLVKNENSITARQVRAILRKSGTYIKKSLDSLIEAGLVEKEVKNGVTYYKSI